MEKNSKIFVAGHRGLVGSAIVRKLQEDGYTNLVLRTKSELDLREQNAVKDFFATEKPEYVFLAAATVGGISYNYTHAADFMYDNLMIQTNVIEAAYRNNTKKFQFLGSACIYPKVTPQPIREEYMLTGVLEPSNEGYALAKIAGLRMCEYYRRQHGFNAISLMPANLYGPNDNFVTEQGHVIPGMMTKFFNAIKNSDSSITCWGDGSPTREFLYVDDLADACVFLMNNYDKAEFINVGSDVEITIKDLSELIKEAAGFQGNVLWDTSLPNGTPLRKLDNSKLFSLGWSPKTSFADGLAKTIQWYKENEANK
jgi:GDP-L-fucose synthase